MINKILEMVRPQSLDKIEKDIIKKQQQAAQLKLKRDALESKKKIDQDIDKLKKQIIDLS